MSCCRFGLPGARIRSGPIRSDPPPWAVATRVCSWPIRGPLGQRCGGRCRHFFWLWKTDQVKPGAQPLAEAGASDAKVRWPVIVRHFVGAGEVWMHLTDETWRLRYRREDRAYARYWGQVVRRLARGKLVAGARGVRLLTDRSEYRLGEAVHVRAQFRNPAQAPTQGPVIVQCESPDQPRRRLELPRRWDLPGRFEMTLQALPAGTYQLRWLPVMSQAESRTEPSAQPMPAVVRFTVSAPPGELARLAVDRQTLTEAARADRRSRIYPTDGWPVAQRCATRGACHLGAFTLPAIGQQAHGDRPAGRPAGRRVDPQTPSGLGVVGW